LVHSIQGNYQDVSNTARVRRQVPQAPKGGSVSVLALYMLFVEFQTVHSLVHGQVLVGHVFLEQEALITL
jgi:hypothetical protein